MDHFKMESLKVKSYFRKGMSNSKSISKLEDQAREIASESGGRLTFRKVRKFRNGYEMTFTMNPEKYANKESYFPELKALRFPSLPRLAQSPNLENVFRDFNSYVRNLGKSFDNYFNSVFNNFGRYVNSLGNQFA